MKQQVLFDFWYLKSEEIELDGSDSGAISYEVAIGVFGDEELVHQLDDIRITGLIKEDMLAFKIEDPSVLFPKLEEEGLLNISQDIKETGFYFVMGEKKLLSI
ncbi:hypothetical protein [Litchfieldia salsa]|uniref:Uncharacterized protein n=1 Tax=Litchfieldia salsa TaxID=930152 RepID=A0A1H0UNY4_9BACI|nr:hypothetical protein [Litchfieldia salsa]SDP67596.1 hypothetical protein SAMN05216565_10546 [Litchfieldia salsa]